MKCYFTFDTAGSRNRSKYFRGALFRNGAKLVYGLPPADAPGCLWFHGVSNFAGHPVDKRTQSAMMKFPGKLILFQNGDEDTFNACNVTPEIIEKASAILMNQMNSDIGAHPGNISRKLGYLNPIIKPMRAVSGKMLAERNIRAMFLGAQTGGRNLGGRDNAREKAMGILMESDLGFVGGLIHQDNYPVKHNLRVSPVKQKEHDKMLADTFICYAFWGNSHLSYRFFEGLANRCLVIAQSLAGIKFSSAGLKPGVHYVEVAADLSDLIAVSRYYLENPDKAQKIADAGYNHFKRNLSYRGIDLPQPIFNEIMEGHEELRENFAGKPLTYSLRSFILKYIKSM